MITVIIVIVNCYYLHIYIERNLGPGPLSVTAGLSPSRLLFAAEPQQDKAVVEIRISLE